MKLKHLTKYALAGITLIAMGSCKSQSKQSLEVQAMLTKIKENFIHVEGGTFLMGSNRFPEATPTRDVTLDSYSISKFETTFEEYDLYCNTIGLEIVHKKYRHLPRNSPKHAAWHMDWFQARAYCQWLGKQLELPIDLPTEAQWEYAARNRGLPVEHATNNGKIVGGENDNYGYKKPVGHFPPNPLGIYEMSGGIQEWTLDWYGNYRSEPQTNPKGRTLREDEIAENLGEKVVRGWHNLSNTTVTRGHRPVESTGTAIGIRCVCNQKTPIN